MLSSEMEMVEQIARRIAKEEIAKATEENSKPAKVSFEKPKAQSGPLTKEAVDKIPK